jgi:hypothetical protein
MWTPRGGETDERWACKPTLMLSQAAEALALRAAFPEAFTVLGRKARVA